MIKHSHLHSILMFSVIHPSGNFSVVSLFFVLIFVLLIVQGFEGLVDENIRDQSDIILIKSFNAPDWLYILSLAGERDN